MQQLGCHGFFENFNCPYDPYIPINFFNVIPLMYKEVIFYNYII